MISLNLRRATNKICLSKKIMQLKLLFNKIEKLKLKQLTTALTISSTEASSLKSNINKLNFYYLKISNKTLKDC